MNFLMDCPGHRVMSETETMAALCLGCNKVELIASWLTKHGLFTSDRLQAELDVNAELGNEKKRKEKFKG
jgi:hypothetical protein